MESLSAGAALLADANGFGHMGGGGRGWMAGGWILIVIAVVLIAWVMQRRDAPAGSGRVAEAEQILATRLARGEIDALEYEEMLAVLRR